MRPADRTASRLPSLSALLLLAACAGEPPALQPVFDLGKNLAYSRLTRETAAVDVGSPPDLEHLLGGWSHPEVEPGSGLAFRWGLEPRSELRFTALEPRPVTLRLEGRPRRGPEGARPAVELLLDDRPVGRIELGPDRQAYEVELAAERLRRGDNRLTLRYDPGEGTAPPAGESRRIAVAWYRIDFEGLSRGGGEPRLEAERGLLFLPWGSRLDYHLRAPAGAVLRSPRSRFVAGGGRLAIRLDRDDGESRELAVTTEPGEIEAALEAAGGEPIRLSLAAVATGPTGDGGGIALEAPAVWAAAPAATPATEPAAVTGGDRPNVVVYLVDTLRADRLGCYGHTRPVSPRIDRFAATATLFENARAQAPWTLPAVASVMTGLWPPAHGVLDAGRRLAPETVTLAEALSGHGYQTAAFVTNGFATEAYGLDQGFDELTLIEARKSSEVHEAAAGWLARRDPERPFFLYLHTLDPHNPYLPAERYRRRFAADADEVWRQIVDNPKRQRFPPTEEVISQLLALYDAEIAENDASFGDTLDALAAAGLQDGALIVFLSDHGEEFHEHGAWTHASNLFPEVLNIPLIVKLPGQREGRRVAQPVQQIDLMPTLLAYLGISPPPTDGRVLPQLLDDGPPRAPAEGRATIYSHTSRENQTTASVIDGDWKLIRRSDAKGITQRLYNWREDPAELDDRAADRPVLTGLLAAALGRALAESRPPGVAEASPDEDVLSNLRALGYVD